MAIWESYDESVRLSVGGLEVVESLNREVVCTT